MTDDQRFAFGPKGRVQADDLAQRKSKHPVRETGDEILGRRERKPREVRQRFHAQVGQLLAVAAHVAAKPDRQRLETFELQLFQLGATA